MTTAEPQRVPRALQVTTTTGSKEEAQRLARLLVEARLAACVQILGPIESTYRWKGEIGTTEEWLLLAKTDPARYDALEATLTAEHSYEVPEILAVAVARGSEPYLAWVAAGTSSG